MDQHYIKTEFAGNMQRFKITNYFSEIKAVAKNNISGNKNATKYLPLLTFARSVDEKIR